MKADLVLTNANVLTMNPAQPKAQAIAVKAEKIVKVGSNLDVAPWIGKNTRVMDLQGKTVLPGLIDTHIHVADFGRVLMWLDLNSVQSIQDLKCMVKKRAENLSVGVWIVGRGWNQTDFAEKRLPSLADLDEAAPDNPVVLYHRCEQTCLVNSRALALADIPSKTGVLCGDATSKVWAKVPEPTPDELSAAICQACQEILKAGITSIHWIVLSPNEIPLIKTLRDQGKLPVRVYLIVPQNLLSQAFEAGLNQAPNGMFKLGAGLIFSDGYLASRTAALTQPYSDAPTEQGKLQFSKPEMAELAEKIMHENLQLVIHCVGDLAVEAALETMQKTHAHRARLEQAAVLNPALIAQIKKNQALVSMQSKVIASEFAVWSVASRLGSERARWLFPVKSLLEAGVKVLGGSDCPMEPLNPLLGVQAAATRAAGQGVSVEQALCMYTVDAAFGSFEESLKGTVEAGKLADFAVFDGDPFAAELGKIGAVTAEMTVLGGQIVYLKPVQ